MSKKDLGYTGERVVPDKMYKDVVNWILHIQRYVFSLNFSVNKKILDVACGTGYGMTLLSSVAKTVEGIDIDKKTIKWAKSNNHFYSPASFKLLDLEKDKITGKFDCVVSFETIEHLEKPEFFLENIHNVLINEGVFIFSVPINEPLNSFHKKDYTWKSIEELIKANFSKYIRWYSQTKEGIFIGKRRDALFILGISYKNIPSFLVRTKLKTKKTACFLKQKAKETLDLTPKTRW